LGRCGGLSDLAGDLPEVERDDGEEAVHDEVEEVDEHIAVEGVEAERPQRRGRLAGGEHEQDRPVADDVGLHQHADPGNDHHVGECERQPEVLDRVRGAREASDRAAEV
jgi:hypothetical protein